MSEFVLLVDPFGSVTLEDDDGEQVWSSDDDEQFRALLGDVVEDAEPGDMDEVLEYLEELGVLPLDVWCTVTQQYADGTEESQEYEPRNGEG